MKLSHEKVVGAAVVAVALYVLYKVYTGTSADIPAANSTDNPQDLSTQIAPQQGAQPTYPNAGVNPTAGINIGGSPLNITYNVPPASTFAPPVFTAPVLTSPGVEGMAQPAGGGGCCDCGEDSPNVNWLSQKISIQPFQIQNALDNLGSVFVGSGQ